METPLFDSLKFNVYWINAKERVAKITFNNNHKVIIKYHISNNTGRCYTIYYNSEEFLNFTKDEVETVLQVISELPMKLDLYKFNKGFDKD